MSLKIYNEEDDLLCPSCDAFSPEEPHAIDCPQIDEASAAYYKALGLPSNVEWKDEDERSWMQMDEDYDYLDLDSY